MRKYPTFGFLSVTLLAMACSPELTNDEDDLESMNAALKAANGTETNGMKFNGMKFNGMKFNGMKFNGMKFNGTQAGGASLEGAALGNVKLEGTKFRGTLADGTAVEGLDFIGATFSGITNEGSTVELGIQDIVQSTSDSEIYLYTVRAHDKDGKWVAVCASGDKKKEVTAIPVLGVWKGDGSVDSASGQFTFGCRGIGAIAKCVEMGYKPWKVSGHHRACVRMVRADYCGDGKSNTRDGNVIDIWDSKGIQKDDHHSYNGTWEFDAEWDEHGAVCMSISKRPDGKKPSCKNVKKNGCDTGKKFDSGALIKNWAQTSTSSSSSNKKSLSGGGTLIINNVHINVD